jgi:Serine dehydrogenase proteinase
LPRMASAKRRPKIQKPPLLFAQSQKIIARTEAKLGYPLLAYWSSNSGSVCQDDVIVMYDLCRSAAIKDRPLALFIKSSGGSGRAALRVINLLRQYAPRLTALVPLECASAATMMALGADEIKMGPLAFLTAVDTSIRHELSPCDIDNELVSVSQDELARVISLWKEHGATKEGNPVGSLMPFVHPLVVGAVDRASSLSIRLCREILSYHTRDASTAERISNVLNATYPSHDYPITLREAERIGLNVGPLDIEVNDLLLELNAVYSEMGQKAVTDFDEHNYHNNEIASIIECSGAMFYYQMEKDWHYRKEERRWTALNDNSNWTKVERVGSKTQKAIFHIR